MNPRRANIFPNAFKHGKRSFLTTLSSSWRKRFTINRRAETRQKRLYRRRLYDVSLSWDERRARTEIEPSRDRRVTCILLSSILLQRLQLIQLSYVSGRNDLATLDTVRQRGAACARNLSSRANYVKRDCSLFTRFSCMYTV